MVVSRYNLTLKTGAGQARVWATDLKTGQPVADMAVSIYDDGGKRIATATTDGDGLATVALKQTDPWAPLTVVGVSGEDMAVVLRN